MKWLADENSPIPTFRFLESKKFDIKHIGIENPSVEDVSVENLFTVISPDTIRQRTITL